MREIITVPDTKFVAAAEEEAGKIPDYLEPQLSIPQVSSICQDCYINVHGKVVEVSTKREAGS